MEKKETLWDQLSMNSIKFKVGNIHRVRIIDNFTTPKEASRKDGSRYCIIPVTENGEDIVIKTSNQSLIKGLKKFNPIAGKTFSIEKKMKADESQFEVKEIDKFTDDLDPARGLD